MKYKFYLKNKFYFFFWVSMIILFIKIIVPNSVHDDSAGASHIVFIVLTPIGIVTGIGMIVKNFRTDIIEYEYMLTEYPILEDVYTINVTSFLKRLRRDIIVHLAYVTYFIITTIVIFLSFIFTNDVSLIQIVVYAIFVVFSIHRYNEFVKVCGILKQNPTSQTCLDIAKYTYDLDYTSYYEGHQDCTYKEMFPPTPRHYNFFRFISIIYATIIAGIGMGLILKFLNFGHNRNNDNLLIILILTLALPLLFLGIKDLITYIFTLKPINA